MFVKNVVSNLKHNHYISEKSTLLCFRIVLKCSRDETFTISAGNLFHKVEVTRLNAQSPYDLSRDTGTCNSIWLDDQRFRDDTVLWRHIINIFISYSYNFELDTNVVFEELGWFNHIFDHFWIRWWWYFSFSSDWFLLYFR